MIADRVITLPEYKDAKRILAYADYNHEVMTGFIIEAAWRDGKEVAVPKVVGQDMVFYKLTDFAQLEKGYFGIPEPARGEIVQWEDAMMVMPGVAFDKENHRVGYGGGEPAGPAERVFPGGHQRPDVCAYHRQRDGLFCLRRPVH